MLNPTLLAAVAGTFALVLLWRRRREMLAPEGHFPPADAVGLFSLAIAVFFVFALGIGLVAEVAQPPDAEAGDGRLDLGLPGAIAGLVLAPLLTLLALRFAGRRALRPRMGVLDGAVGGLWMVLAVWPVVFGLFLSMQVLGVTETQEHLDSIVKRGDGWMWLAASALILAPVCEETLFRGLLYPASRRYFGRPGAIILTSGLFAAIHGTPTVIPPMFAFGVAMALLVEWTGRVSPCIVAHFAFNGFNVAQALLTPPSP